MPDVGRPPLTAPTAVDPNGRARSEFASGVQRDPRAFGTTPVLNAWRSVSQGGPAPAGPRWTAPNIIPAVARRSGRDPEQVRPSNTDRARAVDRLDTALREERLDLVEYDERVRAAEAAATREALDAVLADLPDRPGVREWAAGLRVRAGDRRQAVVWLADALTDGALTGAEHDRRQAAATEATT